MLPLKVGGHSWFRPCPRSIFEILWGLMQGSLLFSFLAQMFGCGSVAQVVLSRGTHGGFLTINLAFGFAVTLAILVAGQVSGKD